MFGKWKARSPTTCYKRVRTLCGRLLDSRSVVAGRIVRVGQGEKWTLRQVRDVKQTRPSPGELTGLDPGIRALCGTLDFVADGYGSTAQSQESGVYHVAMSSSATDNGNFDISILFPRLLSGEAKFHNGWWSTELVPKGYIWSGTVQVFKKKAGSVDPNHILLVRAPIRTQVPDALAGRRGIRRLVFDSKGHTSRLGQDHSCGHWGYCTARGVQ